MTNKIKEAIKTLEGVLDHGCLSSLDEAMIEEVIELLEDTNITDAELCCKDGAC